MAAAKNWCISKMDSYAPCSCYVKDQETGAICWSYYKATSNIVTGGHSAGNRLNSNSAMNFDTGGYTGEWGSEGRAAVLHEKELVLNKADTANMLSIVSLVRDIVSGFGGMPSGANANFNLGIGRYVGDSSNVDQQVIINAEFPNATNREEIQAAFDQMAIQATQYIKKIK